MQEKGSNDSFEIMIALHSEGLFDGETICLIFLLFGQFTTGIYRTPSKNIWTLSSSRLGTKYFASTLIATAGAIQAGLTFAFLKGFKNTA